MPARLTHTLAIPVLASLVLSAGICVGGGVRSRAVITKQNQQEHKTKLAVDIGRGHANHWRWIEITIPENDERLGKLFRAAFVIPSGRKDRSFDLAVDLPIRSNADGSRTLVVGMGDDTDLAQKALVELSCRWPDPSRSSLDTVCLDVGSYLPSR